jgi:ABC-type nitrate/sulfonate/bicarbonate transport system ATPase subunit
MSSSGGVFIRLLQPFGALDAVTRRHLQHELLRIWQQRRKTVVFVTHSVAEAIYFADRIARLRGPAVLSRC